MLHVVNIDEIFKRIESVQRISHIVLRIVIFFFCYEHVSIEILFYQRKFIWELVRFKVWRSQSTFDIRSFMYIQNCSKFF